MANKVYGITIGDPAGIGPEIALKATKELATDYRCVIYSDTQVLERAKEILNDNRELNCLNASKDYIKDYELDKINYIEVKSLHSAYELGKVQAECGRAAYDYVVAAIADAKAKKIAGVVTCPLNKEALNLGGVHYAGHTEIFATLTDTKDYAMLLTGHDLRVVHVSTHVSLREACDRVTRERVLRTIELAYDAAVALSDKEKPLVAVAGLNPHSGESGLFGVEEMEQIIPAIEDAKAEGINVVGPVPPDTVFMRAAKGEFDVVVAMYHDQGHIPLKMVDFMDGINVTVGLPIIRTSVDHGTAFDLSGTGSASPASLIQAIKAAKSLVDYNYKKPPSYVVIADDFTGSTDTGVQFIKYGLRTSVKVLDKIALGEISSITKVLVVDTETRNVDKEKAELQIESAASRLEKWNRKTTFYKKIDSTMRGNIAHEVKALADKMNFKAIVCTPAFPNNGRIVKDSIVYLNDVPIAQTKMKDDPIKPVTKSNLIDIFNEVPSLNPVALTAEQVKTPNINEFLEKNTCFCCDATTNEELLDLVNAILNVYTPQEVLWVGSAGLAAALLAATGKEQINKDFEIYISEKPALFVVGSLNEKNLVQMKKLLNSSSAQELKLDKSNFIFDRDNEFSRLVEYGSAILSRGNNLIITTGLEEGEYMEGQSLNLSAFMGRVSKELVLSNPLCGLYVTGGETAMSLLQELNCGESRVLTEMESGIPLIRLDDGDCPNLRMITKAGAFGNEDTLLNALKYLKG